MSSFGPRLLAVLIVLAAAPGGAQSRPQTLTDDPELPAARVAAQLFGAVADNSRFLMTPPGSLETLVNRAREPGHRPLVVVQYGDSHTQSGVLPRELRDQLAQGGRASPGFVAPGLHNLGDASVTMGGRWKKKNWIKPEDAGSFGPLGMAFVTRDVGARLHLHLAQPAADGTRVTAFYSRAAAHLPFRMTSGTRVLTQVGAEPPAGDPDHHLLGSAVVVLPVGATELELAVVSGKKAGPDLRFFGFLVQAPDAVVEWDALGITGTSVQHPLLRGDKTIEEYLAFRQPDLIIVWFGSNSLVAPNFDAVSYEKDYGAFLARLAAAAPQASRLALGPPDLERRPATCPVWYGRQKRHLSSSDRALLPRYICAPETTIVHRPGRPDLFPVRSIHTVDGWREYIDTCRPQTLPGVLSTTDAERSAARTNGYAFFDTFAFMDGPGSIHRWACQTPRLAAYDLVHLTADGYSTVAQGVWGALPATLRGVGLTQTAGAGGTRRGLR